MVCEDRLPLRCRIQVLTTDLSLLDGFQPKGHHLAAHDEAEVLLPELSKEPATGNFIFQVDKELDSKPFVQLQKHEAAPAGYLRD